MNTTEKASDINAQVLNVPIEDIIPNRFQPRLSFDEGGLQELAASIKEHGIIQPLVLRRLQDKYEIIAGERRYKAAKIAGLTSVPAIISELNDRESAEVAIVENVQRRDLTSIEEAKSYKALLDKEYLTQEELAKKMGLSQSAISNKLRLLSLSPNVQEALINGKISERHARSLLVLDDLETQDAWLNIIINERLTVKELDRRLKNLKNIKEDDVPIIKEEPNIEKIKENAQDIISSEQSKIIEEEKKEGKIPNTFFNFLEQEKANMNPFEVLEEQKEEKNDLESSTKSPKEETEKEDDIQDEIEMLDFAPESKQVKDMSKAKSLVEALNKSLIDNGYVANIVTDDLDKELKYTIIIQKD